MDGRVGAQGPWDGTQGPKGGGAPAPPPCLLAGARDGVVMREGAYMLRAAHGGSADSCIGLYSLEEFFDWELILSSRRRTILDATGGYTAAVLPHRFAGLLFLLESVS